ncbi:NAD(P)H-hydrate dehydratase [Brevundimonas sp. 2R-24]|uniref:ADP-dependent (S)-NAD(P)H-hydrate dehydratase n=1 Tax=Peiella sedimenti TaxID=3061083 RepID=A0ABT8SN74_9CAUL|nr:NAD(P)H-hydrate dehydratase [Caulobacteraceae bacterium XZ-24]
MDVKQTPDWLDRFPWPGAETHKHSRGRLGVVSGGPWATGAARLASRAGQRIGAGWVEVWAPEAAAPVLAPVLEAALLRPFGDAAELAEPAERLDAMVIGPALGRRPEHLAMVETVLAGAAALVLDADALSLFSQWPEALFDRLSPNDVLTPHLGEFDRLFPDLMGGGHRADLARRAAERAGCVVVLKGNQTVIASPDGRVEVSAPAPAWLATAGTGDVLAGMIGGLLAQKMDAFDAARAAVWIHAQAAGRFGPGLIAEDLPDLIPPVLGGLWQAAQRKGEGA